MWLDLLNAASSAEFVHAPGREDPGIASSTALCIIRGNMCRQSFRNVQIAETSLGLLHQTSFQAFRTWRTEHRCCRSQEALRQAGFLQRHRRHLGPLEYVRPEPQQARNDICWPLQQIGDGFGRRTGRKMTVVAKPICPNSRSNLPLRSGPKGQPITGDHIPPYIESCEPPINLPMHLVKGHCGVGAKSPDTHLALPYLISYATMQSANHPLHNGAIADAANSYALGLSPL